MKICGICRFSFIGRGDWTVYRKKSDEEAAAAYDEQAKVLFHPDRMNHRFATFEHITLASLKAQTDQNFQFVILASDLMPLEYRQRLEAMCSDMPQIAIRYFPPIKVLVAQKLAFEDMGIPYRKTLQFRLDDDDALSSNYIERMRQYCAPLASANLRFAASFKNAFFIEAESGRGIVLDLPFMSAGAALCHPNHSIFMFGHFALEKKFASVSIPYCHSLILKHGSNDSGGIRSKHKLKSTSETLGYLSENLPFLEKEGLSLMGHA